MLKKIKLLLLIPFLFLPLTGRAEETKNQPPKNEKMFKELLPCLAQEELFIHKEGLHRPIYLLNQEVFNLLSTNKHNLVKNSDYKKICANNIIFPSLALLREVLLNDLELKNQNDLAIGDFKQDCFDVFLRHLTNLDALNKDESCNIENIPEIDDFMNRYYHFQAELGLENFLKEKGPLSKLFNAVIKANEGERECLKKRK